MYKTLEEDKGYRMFKIIKDCVIGTPPLGLKNQGQRTDPADVL